MCRRLCGVDGIVCLPAHSHDKPLDAARAKKLIDALEEGPIPAEGELSKVLATVPTWSQLRREWLDIKHQSRKEGREWPWFKVAYLSEAFGLVANEGFEPW